MLGAADAFLGVLEVYARNLGPQAVGKITSLLEQTDDEELAGVDASECGLEAYPEFSALK